MPQADEGHDHGSPTSTPRWVKVLGIVALVLALLVGIIVLTGVGGSHGPGRHLPPGGASDTPSAMPATDPTMTLVAAHRL